MKAILRLPGKEIYSYAEVEAEVLSPLDALVALDDALTAYRGGEGLPRKEWNQILDRYLQKGGMSSDEGSAMDERQKWMIHELDKAMSRITRLETNQ